MSFKYWKKRLAIWASNSQVMGFLSLMIFCWYVTFNRSSTNRMTFDWSSTNRTKQLVTHFFNPELEFFVLDFNVDHSKPMSLRFCHGLPTLQIQNLTKLKVIIKKVLCSQYNLLLVTSFNLISSLKLLFFPLIINSKSLSLFFFEGVLLIICYKNIVKSLYT